MLNAVVRNEKWEVNVISLSKVKIQITKAITVLNSKGKKKAWERFSYDKNNKIVAVSARMYNSLGQEVEKWNRKDWEDISYDPYGTIYSESRSILCLPIENEYPYTIEYNLTIERDYTYGINGWYPSWEDNMSVERSSYILSYSPEIKIKYKEYHFNNQITKKEQENTITWTMRHSTAHKSEPYSPVKNEYLPHLKVGLKEFKYDHYLGHSETWEDFGKFRVELNSHRDILPKERQTEIDKIAATCHNDLEKVQKLYTYMQAHTRYINIIEGIGGIQPFPAETVSKNGYGDCKALSNYMKAILKSVGIKSYYTVVKAGKQDYYFDPEFISHQSNHVILCVPMPTDTIWLECTSQTMPCGFLGSFTDNRTVLLITEHGGVLAQTPKYGKEENKIIRTANVKIAPSGDGTASVTTIYKGLEYDNKHWFAEEDKEDQLKLLHDECNIPNFKITHFKIDNVKTRKPSLYEELNLTLPSYASKSGSRLFLPLKLIKKRNYVPPKLQNRALDIVVKKEYCNLDTISYSIPENYAIEIIPEAYTINSKFGQYKCATKIKGNKIIYSRYMEMNSGKYPAEEYDSFIDFFEQIKKNDQPIAILKQVVQ